MFLIQLNTVRPVGSGARPWCSILLCEMSLCAVDVCCM